MNPDWSLIGFTRINVVGSSGSGKSTIGKKIAQTLDLPYVESDELFWLPDWTEPPEEQFLATVKAVVAKDCWVLDGNYSRTIPIKWPRTHAVVWADLPYPVIFWQVLLRTLRRSITQEELWAGNRESLTKAFFSRDSILLWSLSNMKRVRKGYEGAMSRDDLKHIRFIRLRSRSDVAAFLRQLATEHKKGPTT